ncbi:hypothetical protein BSKO_05398 [Bryopsis sp. KO-2023]|nr:hypothetical protein BSKO_05398 [Bryopsis sp. KO-2023]
MIERLRSQGLSTAKSEEIVNTVQHLRSSRVNEPQIWREISKTFLNPDLPFPIHRSIFDYCYETWSVEEDGPPPVWIPMQQGAKFTNLAHFMKTFSGDGLWERLMSGDPVRDFPLLHAVSVDNPEVFWQALFRHLSIQFHTKPSRILRYASHPDAIEWLPGCRLNIADICLTRGDPDDVAIVWAKEPEPSRLHTMSWRHLRDMSVMVASAVSDTFEPGTSIAINMPMTVISVALYLGIILAGCVVVSIADSFAPPEVATRLKISKTKAIFTQDFVIRSGKKFPLYSKVIQAGPEMVVVLPVNGHSLEVPLRSNDTSWAQFLNKSGRLEDFQPRIGKPDDATNILFSSGTTGEPKAIPWTHITPLRCTVDGWAHQDVRRGDVVCWPTNLGWMMGPWLVYAALMNRATIAIYEGSPLGRDFCEFVSCSRVSMLGVVPSIVRAWRKNGSTQGIDWGSIRCFSSTGEASNAEEYHWLTAQAGYKPVIEYCGGTEIGGGFLTGTLLQPQCSSTFSTPSLGTSVTLVSENASQNPHGEKTPAKGELALVPPMLGSSQKLLNRDHHKVYYEGMPMADGKSVLLRRHGDEMERLPGGYYCAHGRSDDTMNLGGIKVSSVEIERVVMASVDQIKEAAAVGLTSSRGGPQKLTLVVVLDEDASRDAKAPNHLMQLCQTALRSKLNPLFKVSELVTARSLPRTASNKIMRRVLRDKLMQSKL